MFRTSFAFFFSISQKFRGSTWFLPQSTTTFSKTPTVSSPASCFLQFISLMFQISETFNSESTSKPGKSRVHGCLRKGNIRHNRLHRIQQCWLYDDGGLFATVSLNLQAFADLSLEKNMANYECNATAALQISHHFVNKLLNCGRKGAIFFTSSPACFMPCPFSVMYGCTKAFLTSFGSSLAVELKR